MLMNLFSFVKHSTSMYFPLFYGKEISTFSFSNILINSTNMSAVSPPVALPPVAWLYRRPSAVTFLPPTVERWGGGCDLYTDAVNKHRYLLFSSFPTYSRYAELTVQQIANEADYNGKVMSLLCFS